MKNKWVFILRTRISDNDNWSDPIYYTTEKSRDNAAAFNRIIGGLRVYSSDEKIPREKFDQMKADFEFANQ